MELRLLGDTRNDIARRLKLSGETVSRHLENFKGSLSERAAEQLENLIQLSLELRKSRKSLPEALNATHLCARIEEIGIGTDELGSFIAASKKTAKTMGVEAENYARAAVKLAKLETETGQNYAEIIQDFEEKVKLTQKLSKEIEDLKSRRRESEDQFARETRIRENRRRESDRQLAEIKHKFDIELENLEEKKRQSRKELELQVAKSRLTLEDLSYASALRDALLPYGFPISDVATVPKLIRHIESSGRDPRTLLLDLAFMESLDDRRSKLREEKAATESLLKTVKSSLVDAQKQLSETREEEKMLSASVSTLETRLESLAKETESKQDRIMVADCLYEAFLTENPADIDGLFICASELKKARSDPRLDLEAFRANFDPQIRGIVKKTFLIKYGGEFASKKDYETVVKNWIAKDKENKSLRTHIEELNKNNTALNNTIAGLTGDVKTLKQQIRDRDEDEQNAAEQDLKYGFFSREKPAICKNCGEKNPMAAKYCIKCGKPIEPKKPDPKSLPF
jgi:predicted nuclease with TOPRIM domain/ribosomal protein L40E